MSIRTKLLLAFSLVIAATALLGFVAIKKTESVGDLVVKMYDGPLMSINFARSARTGFLQLERMSLDWSRGLLADGEPVDVEVMEEAWEVFIEDIEVVAERSTDPRITELVAKVNADGEAWWSAIGAAIEGDEGKRSDLVEATSRWRAAIDENLDLIVEYASENGYIFRQNATGTIAETRDFVLWLAGASMAVGFAAALLLAQMIARPINRMTRRIASLTEGEMEREIPYTERRDEIGAIARAVGFFKETMIEKHRLEAMRAEEEVTSKARQKSEMLEMSEVLEDNLGDWVGNIQVKASDMYDLADRMTATANSVSSESGAVSEAADTASANVRTVAGAADEMSTSINEIDRKVDRSKAISEQAVGKVEQSNEKIETLTENSRQIDDIIALINDIANQTNLLALNATIEAARAGEAGKGFAVVASEVKNLAVQTTRATDEVREHVDAIRDATREAALSITEIGETVREVNDITTEIEGAMKEQAASTGQIATSMREVAAGTQSVFDSTEQVTQASREAEELADQVRRNASDVNQTIEELQTQLKTILRRSSAGNRRQYPRVGVSIPTRARYAERWHDIALSEMSEGGARISKIEAGMMGETIALEVPEVGLLDSTIRNEFTDCYGVEFELNEAAHAALCKLLDDVEDAA